jgi:hypothetical protein
MKILYAASNRSGSFFQLKRFLERFKSNHIIKVAAYKKSSGNLPIDFTLDSLYNFSNASDYPSFTNDNYKAYASFIRTFNPDLIISDLEIYTSNIALENKIKIWQVSPVLLYYATPNEIKYNLGIYKYNTYIFNKTKIKNDYINFILNNSDKNIVISHFCDVENIFELKDNFVWCRPDYILADDNNIEYEFLSASLENNKNILSLLNNKKSVVFSSFYYEQYNSLKMKNIFNDKEYPVYLSKSKYIICEGDSEILSDAFYNMKSVCVAPKQNDIENVMMAKYTEYYKLGKISNIDLNDIHFNISLNETVKSLSQFIEEN